MPRTHRALQLTLILAAGTLSTLAAQAIAQPQSFEAPPTPAQPSPPLPLAGPSVTRESNTPPRRGERDPAAFGGLLTQLIERSETFSGKLKTIKTRLEGGESPQSVRADFDAALRTARDGLLAPNRPMGGPPSPRDGGPDGGSMENDDGPLGRARGTQDRGGERPGDRLSGPGGERGSERLGERMAGTNGERMPERAGPRGSALGPEDRERIAAALREVSPQGAAELDLIRAKNGAMADRFLNRLAPKVRGVMDHRNREDAEFAAKKADLDSFIDVVRAGRELAEEGFGQNRDEVREKLKLQLRSALGSQMDAKIRLQELQIADVTRRAERMREELDHAKANREKLLDDRVDEAVKSPRPPG